MYGTGTLKRSNPTGILLTGVVFLIVALMVIFVVPGLNIPAPALAEPAQQPAAPIGQTGSVTVTAGNTTAVLSWEKDPWGNCRYSIDGPGFWLADLGGADRPTCNIDDLLQYLNFHVEVGENTGGFGPYTDDVMAILQKLITMFSPP